MRDLLLLVAFSLTVVVASGCGTLIFNADFNADSGSPDGPPPGSPSDDQIVVQDPGNPVVSSAQVVFHPPQDKTFFFSRPVKESTSTKTVFWKGRLVSGDGPFGFLLSAENAPGTPFLTNPMELKFTNNQVQVIALPPGNAVLHSHALVPNSQHDVFISLRLKSGTYRMTIQQSGAPEIEFTGALDPLTANTIKNHSRIVLQAGFLPNATGTDEYTMDDVIMRERN